MTVAAHLIPGTPFQLLVAPTPLEMLEHLQPLTRRPEQLEIYWRSQDPTFQAACLLGPGTFSQKSFGHLVPKGPIVGDWVASIPALLMAHPGLSERLCAAVSPKCWAYLRQGLQTDSPKIQLDYETCELLLDQALSPEWRIPPPIQQGLYEHATRHRPEMAMFCIPESARDPRYQNQQRLVHLTLEHMGRQKDKISVEDWQRFYETGWVQSTIIEGLRHGESFLRALDKALGLPNARISFPSNSIFRRALIDALKDNIHQAFPNIQGMIQASNILRNVDEPIDWNLACWSRTIPGRYAAVPTVPSEQLDWAIDILNNLYLDFQERAWFFRGRTLDECQYILERLNTNGFKEIKWYEPQWPLNEVVFTKQMAIHFCGGGNSFHPWPRFVLSLRDEEIFQACLPSFSGQSLTALLSTPEILQIPKKHVLQLVRLVPAQWHLLSKTSFGAPAYEVAISQDPSIYWESLRNGAKGNLRLEQIARGLPVSPSPGECAEEPLIIKSAKQSQKNPTTNPPPAESEAEFSF